MRAPITSIRRAIAILAAFLCLAGIGGVAQADTADVQTAWRLLDYMVDYGGAVSGGRIKSASEICRDDRIRGFGIRPPYGPATHARARTAGQCHAFGNFDATAARY
ncbi:hypothetical protein C100_03650 [Sphingobium sp. C100]|nr:hypothetical protein C100_03650 [Sphingobium sp. C100]